MNSGAGYRLAIDKLLFWGLAVYFSFVAFEAPIRYFSSKVGLEGFIFFKDFVLFLLLFLLIFHRLFKGKVDYFFSIVFSVVLFSSIVGLLHQINFIQILFAYKVYGLFFLGLLSIRFWRRISNKMLVLISLLAVFSLFGQILELFYQFPWVGESMGYRGLDLEMSRTAYAAGGFKRVSGFGRSWSNPAYFSLMAICLHLSYSRDWNFAKLFLMLAFFCGIVISTNKGALGSFFLVAAFFFAKRTFSINFLRALFVICVFFVVILPVASWAGLIELETYSLVGRVLLSSFIQRVDSMWPSGFNLIREHGSFLFGRGIGGIGAVQKIFETNLEHPADNVFLFLFGTFGAIAFVFFGFLIFKIFSVDIKVSGLNSYVNYVLLVFLGVGLIGSGLENGVLNFFFGLVISAMFYSQIYLIQGKDDL